jgi:chromate reductase
MSSMNTRNASRDTATPSTSGHAALRVLALPGSLRRASYNRALLAAAVLLQPSGMAIELADAPVLPPFDEDVEQSTRGGPEAVQRLRAQVAAADGLLIATPEYNQSLPGALKNAIDWLSRQWPDEVLVGKPVAVIGASSGRWGTRLAQAALRQVLYATGARVLPAPHLYVREAESLFDADGHLLDAATRESLAALLSAFARWIVLCRNAAIA